MKASEEQFYNENEKLICGVHMDPIGTDRINLPLFLLLLLLIAQVYYGVLSAWS